MRFRVGDSTNLGQGFYWLSGLVFLVASMVLVFVVYLWLAGPGEVDKSRSWEVNETSIIEWMEKGIEAEASFERAWTNNPNEVEDFGELELAIKYQYQLKAVDPNDEFGAVSRLNRLLKRLEDTKGKRLYSRARALSSRASELISQGDSIRAYPLLEEALEGQEWINARLHGSSLVDRVEAARIRQQLERLQTVDAAAEVNRLVEEGRTAYSERNWEDAETNFERALVLQESINLNLPESSHVRWRLVQELKEFQRRIDAARMNKRLETLLSASGDLQPAETLERSLKLQALINERYPTTEFYNPDRLNRLKQRLASDQSSANAALLSQQAVRLDAILQEKNWSAVHAVLLELEGTLKQFESRFPISLLPDPSLKSRVDWMIEHLASLESLGEEVYANLVDHPKEDLQVFRTEVDQALYLAVMGDNPSRWVGERFPVDSVGLDQAKEFCLKLGWALGRRVVLPEWDWLTSLDKGALDEEAVWLAGNSQFQSQPVGTSKVFWGLYDLYGNLAEWVVDDDDPSLVGVFGGSGADSWNTVKTKSVNWVAPNFRSRWAGFRFCVLN